MKNADTERNMLDRLNRRYGTYNGNGMRFTRAEHVKVTAGHSAGRICDYMAMDLWTGMGLERGPYLHGHEVKVSRSDWLTELKDPSKADAFAVYCDYWWLAVSDGGIVHPGELPEGWGLLVGYGLNVREVVKATKRTDVLPMPRDLQATFARSVVKTTARLTMSDDGAVRQVFQRMKGSHRTADGRWTLEPLSLSVDAGLEKS